MSLSKANKTLMREFQEAGKLETDKKRMDALTAAREAVLQAAKEWYSADPMRNEPPLRAAMMEAVRDLLALEVSPAPEPPR